MIILLWPLCGLWEDKISKSFNIEFSSLNKLKAIDLIDTIYHLLKRVLEHILPILPHWFIWVIYLNLVYQHQGWEGCLHFTASENILGQLKKPWYSGQMKCLSLNSENWMNPLSKVVMQIFFLNMNIENFIFLV